MARTTATFDYEGHRLAYDDEGSADRVVLLIPGMFMTRRMQWPLAERLVAAGNRVLTFDPVGFGESDHPTDYCAHSVPIYAQQAIALLDHLGIDRAVVGGTSCGANISLAASVAAPHRVQGLIIESPVLDKAVVACAFAGFPALAAWTYGAPVTRLLARAIGSLPRRSDTVAGMVLEWLSHDPAEYAAAFQGIVLGGPKLPGNIRKEIGARTLVIGHRFDPIHPHADDTALAEELADARYLPVKSLLELRKNPDRVAPDVAAFVASCWDVEPVRSLRPVAGELS